MSALPSADMLRTAARGALDGARAGVSILADGLGPLGVIGATALLTGIVALGAAEATRTEALALESQAAALHEAARHAARVRMRAPSVRREAVAPIAMSVGLPVQKPSAPVLPGSVFAQAERRGLKLGPVEYRAARSSASVRRVDVQFTATGRYLPARQWLADALATMPHAQIVELSLQRAGDADTDLEIRVVLALHFGANG
ncbi:MAG: hypothetical protein ACK5PW_02840 [Burkholderiales bacterium]